jgi:hypothetical protein
VAGRATWAVAYLPSCVRRAGTTPGTTVRSVFHFLTDGPDRDRYRRTMSAALGPGARVVVGTFAEDGLQLCSGLPTMRYGHAALAGAFGESSRCRPPAAANIPLRGARSSRSPGSG